MRYIGFDFGDGESCVTYLAADSDIEPRVLPVDGRLSFLTAVATLDGETLIGDSAATQENARDLRVRFKSRYLTAPEEASPEIERFAKAVAHRVGAQTPLAECETTVGCPAGWNAEERERYRALFERAGFPKVRVISESRAAFLYARHARTVRLDPALLSDSALVIDIGSSTLDFAYVVDGHEAGVGTFGDVALGGGLIDECVLEDAVEASPERERVRAVLDESPSWRSYCLLAARRVKERFFLNEQDYEKRPCEEPVTLYFDGVQNLTLSITPKSMWRITNKPLAALDGRSFRTCLSEALLNARAQTEKRPPRLVMLTGGASRMTFFHDMCREAFPDAALVACPEPEYAIARGLAYAGRVDAMLAAFRAEVAAFTAGDAVESLVRARVPDLMPRLSEVLTALSLEQAAVPCAERWRSGETRTLKDMNDEIERRVAAAVASRDAQERMAEPIEKWVSGIVRELEEPIYALCDRYKVPRENMNLPAIRARASGSLRYRIDDFSGINIVNTVCGVVLAVVAALLCGGEGTALIVTGLPGIVAGLVIGGVAALLGKRAVQELLTRADIPVFLRKPFRTSSLLSDKNKAKLRASITQSLLDDAPFTDALVTGVADELDGYLNRMACESEIAVG